MSNMPALTITKFGSLYVVHYTGSDVVQFKSTIRAYCRDFINNFIGDE